MDYSIFKSYDVRGIYPSELNEEAASNIGRAFVLKMGVKKVVVGYDARLSSEALLKALIEGMTEEGADVYSIGLVPTEALYFAVQKYDFDAGVMITASHNPKEYNGMKMMTKKGEDTVWIRGKDLKSAVQEYQPQEVSKGQSFEKDIWSDYIAYILQFKGDIKPLKIAIDASNGVIGKAIEKVKGNLPVEITQINFVPDGNFPNHSPNPLEPGSTDQIKEAITKNNLDLGIIFDGDADRIFLVDEKGDIVSADIALLLIAKSLLEKYPGSVIAYNAICSRAVREFVAKWGGKPVRTAVGFVNVREGLMNNKGVMGGELSAHYCFRDYFYNDCGMMAFLYLLQIVSKEQRPVSEIIKELSIYFKSAESNFKVEDKDAIIEKIKEKYTDGQQDFLDGITVEYDNWWFNVRGSNTEPLLRLTIEAETEELLAQKKAELTDIITK